MRQRDLPAAIRSVVRRMRTKLAQFEFRISDARRTDRARELPNEDVDRLSGFTFSLEQLNQNLKELVDRIGDLAENTIS